jgi:hypothetical protein
MSARYFVPFVAFCKKDLTRWCEDFLSPTLENKVFLDTSVEVGLEPEKFRFVFKSLPVG